MGWGYLHTSLCESLGPRGGWNCAKTCQYPLAMFLFVQWKEYFHSVKDENVPFNEADSSFTSWKYSYHCTHNHSLFVYYPSSHSLNECSFHFYQNDVHMHRSLFWYGFSFKMLNFLFLQFPNFLGVILGLIQLLLFVWYPSTPTHRKGSPVPTSTV